MPGKRRVKFGDSCIKCGTELTPENTYIRSRYEGNYAGEYISSVCKKCNGARTNEWKSNNKDRVKSYFIERYYGMTLEEYNERVKLQLGGCAICKQPCASGQNLSVDHDHITGQVRDLLCKSCNFIIGNCNEDEEILINAIEYLKRHQMKKAV